MRNKMLKPVALLLFAFGITTAHAQQAPTATGGDASGSGGTVAYSVGQIVYTTHSGTSGTVAQGVQQPYEISVVVGLDMPTISLELSAFPNPTTSFLTLNLGDADLSNLRFQLFDINGKLIDSQTITSSSETIRMENLPTATYFLKITKNDTEVKTFKIIKN